jgi:hypothetical protein
MRPEQELRGEVRHVSRARSDTAAGTDSLTWRFGKRGHHSVNVKNINRVLVVPLFCEKCGAIGIECKCIHINCFTLEVMLNSVLQSYTQAILSVLSIIIFLEI